jgi:uncharacterized protein RhaS with RHS repeats
VHTNNRYYSNGFGRFMTPDPFTASAAPADPQSWNRYAYTRGDPVNRLDPSGMGDCPADFCVTGYGSAGDGDGSWGTEYGGTGSFEKMSPMLPYPTEGLVPTFSVTVSAPGGNGSANYQDALRAAKQAQSLEKGLKDSGPCDQVLQALGMSWQGLQSAVAAESFQDGTESSATMVSLFAGSTAANQQAAINQYGNQTIRNYLANQGSSASAVSSAGGNLVFLNYLQFGGLHALDNEATIMHEALHNATGMTDYQIQTALQGFGLKAGTSSQNITNLMMKDCVF